MEVIQYQGLAGRTINPALTHEQMQDHALKGMVGEIGEIIQSIRKSTRATSSMRSTSRKNSVI